MTTNCGECFIALESRHPNIRGRGVYAKVCVPYRQSQAAGHRVTLSWLVWNCPERKRSQIAMASVGVFGLIRRLQALADMFLSDIRLHYAVHADEFCDRLARIDKAPDHIVELRMFCVLLINAGFAALPMMRKSSLFTSVLPAAFSSLSTSNHVMLYRCQQWA